ncbi:MAG: PLDc N-terminal domain-containing protein [Desulfobacterales bacterium]|nr:PLDc N-terminal domain-containing protein [Desulfobacterales bacterium]
MNIPGLIIVLALLLILFLLTVWALVDVSMKAFPSMGEKVIWWLIALIPFIGWLIYLVFGFRRGTRTKDFA